MNIKTTISLIRDYGIEYVLTGLLGGLPSPIGAMMRSIFYQPFIGKIKLSASIQPGVRLTGIKNIEIGNSVRIRKGSRISSKGNRIIIRDNVWMDYDSDIRAFSGYGGLVEIGEGTHIGPGVYITGPGKVTIGRNCLIAVQSMLIANNHVFSDLNVPIHSQGLVCKGIQIEEDCWLGAGVKVLDGVTIGRGSVIGAGSVITRDIPAYSVAVGVPAKVIRQRSTEHQPNAGRGFASLPLNPAVLVEETQVS